MVPSLVKLPLPTLEIVLVPTVALSWPWLVTMP